MHSNQVVSLLHPRSQGCLWWKWCKINTIPTCFLRQITVVPEPGFLSWFFGRKPLTKATLGMSMSIRIYSVIQKLYIHTLLQEHWGAVRTMIYPAPTSCTPNDSITVINSYLSSQLASWVSLHIASWERLCDSSWRLMWTVLGHLKWKALWKRQIVNWEKDITNLHHLRNT